MNRQNYGAFDLKSTRNTLMPNWRAATPHNLGKVWNDMLAEHGPSGRMEKRLLIMVAVRLEPAQGVGNDKQEKAYIDNITPHGARVISSHPWQVGELVKLTSLNEGPVCGQVVYCHDLSDDRHAIGVHIVDHRIPWSIVERFWGT